jgi:hypothetical protein
MYSKRQLIQYISSATALSCLLFVFESCLVKVKPESIAYDKQLAQQEIEKLHGRFNSEDFEAIYNQEAPGLQQAMSRRDFLSFLKNVHEEFGDFEGILDKRINIRVGTPVQIRAVYNSKFEKEVLTEMFVFLKDGDEIQLANYTISKGRSELPAVDD